MLEWQARLPHTRDKLPHVCVERPHVIWLFLIGLRYRKALDGVKKLAQRLLRMFMVQLEVR